MRRLVRFRTTADPMARPVAMPKRVVPRSVLRTLAARRGWDRMIPRSWSAAKSCGRESITGRGRCRSRSLVRPTGASDPALAVRRERGGRPRTSCGRGSRVPWRGGASWAEKSASSGLRGILSIRPRGLVNTLTPEGTRTRPAPTGARRVLRPADDRPDPERVSNVPGGPQWAQTGRFRGLSGRREKVVWTTIKARAGREHRYSHGVSSNRVAWPVARCYLSNPSPPRPPPSRAR